MQNLLVKALSSFFILCWPFHVRCISSFSCRSAQRAAKIDPESTRKKLDFCSSQWIWLRITVSNMASAGKEQKENAMKKKLHFTIPSFCPQWGQLAASVSRQSIELKEWKKFELYPDITKELTDRKSRCLILSQSTWPGDHCHFSGAERESLEQRQNK